MALIKSPKCLARALLLLAGFVSLALFTLQVSGTESTVKKCSVNSFRLPRRIEPMHYDLVIEPNFDSGTFKGVVKINVRSSKDKKQSSASSCMSSLKNHIFPSERDPPNQVNTCDPSNIILHADKQIALSEINFKLVEDDKDKITMTGICRDSKNEMIVINLDRPLPAGSNGQFRISFQGLIRDDLRGFYKSAYNDATSGANGAKRPYNAVTQFEPTDARKAFPCFDEPDLKATFSVTIKHARDLVALSNMQAISEQSDETKTVFAKTPLMSTYLLAFAVGKFDHIEAVASDGTQIGIWTPPNSGKSYELTLTSAVRAYRAVRDYFQTIEQPLKKIDFVGCVSAVAAMENWGLVMFNEDLLPVKDGQTPRNFFNGLSVVTHELVHHWMGNLVTMRWWNDMWLNEGFTVFITQLINQQLYPEYKYDLWSQTTDFSDALKLDASDKSHPIRNTLALVKSGLQIEDVDDTITYGKSAALLRMLSDSIGAEMMQTSINKFVSANLYNNVAADDMIDSFAKTAAGFKVRKLMTSWLDQAGFPLVRVKLSLDSRTLMLTQERFGIQTPLGANDKEEKKNIEEARKQKWIIPVRIAINDGESVEIIDYELMKDRQLTVSLPKSFNAEAAQSWLKLNANSGGYYRVIYEDARLMRAIMLAIGGKTMKAADRLNFYDDIIALTKIGLYSSKDLDTMIGWFMKETEEEILYKLARDIVSFDSGSSSSGPTMINWRKLLLNYYKKASQSGPTTTSDGGLHGQRTLERVERSLKKLGLLVEAC